MNYELVLTARARADILRNAEWWALNHSSDQAIAWFDSIKPLAVHVLTVRRASQDAVTTDDIES